MSRYLSSKYSMLEPYTPGEQPKDMKYVKLNTNESPFPPSQLAQERAGEAIKRLQLYSDPDCTELVKAISEAYGIEKDEVIFTNGSDEALNFAFMAYCDNKHMAAFPDITYGFYPVFAQINNIPYAEIPLKEDFSIDINDYIGLNKTIFIANPNAPTGMVLSLDEIEQIVRSNPDNVVVIDEAYVDFGADSCVPLIHKYNNLLVTQTFSKSRSMAGARLGFAVGCKDLIADLNAIKYSTNPYNVNSMTMAAGVGALADDAYMKANCRTIEENRKYTEEALKEMGFEMTDSLANFLFVRHPNYSGEKLYLDLKSRGVLIRHFTKDRICEYNRITIGTKEQMDVLLSNIKEIISGK